jgi:hypothetical protein
MCIRVLFVEWSGVIDILSLFESEFESVGDTHEEAKV